MCLILFPFHLLICPLFFSFLFLRVKWSLKVFIIGNHNYWNCNLQSWWIYLCSTPPAMQWQTTHTAPWGRRGRTSAFWSQVRAVPGRLRRPRRSCSTMLSPVQPASRCRRWRTACCSPILCSRWDIVPFWLKIMAENVFSYYYFWIT